MTRRSAPIDGTVNLPGDRGHDSVPRKRQPLSKKLPTARDRARSACMRRWGLRLGISVGAAALLAVALTTLPKIGRVFVEDSDTPTLEDGFERSRAEMAATAAPTRERITYGQARADQALSEQKSQMQAAWQTAEAFSEDETPTDTEEEDYFPPPGN